ncbi:SseB family protein [Actinomadura sp. LOL_011]|uniref:SseB family protein n=1 Tax=Actinomadura sp. LOL_011 TaxID=3345410 RepID=UPI003A80D91A
MATVADAWRPTSELERRLAESVRAGDQEGYFRVLAGAELVLPVPPDAVDDVLANTAQPTWPTQEEDGRVHVLTYTSAAAMRACLGPAYRHFMTLRFEDIAQSWPDAAWWLAVDVPGHGVADVALPIEARLPSWFVRQVAEGDGRPPRVGRPGAGTDGPWEELRGQHRDLPREETRRPEFQPANDVERELLRAAANNDHDLFLQTLAGTEVLLPVPEGTDYSLRPGRPGFPWQTRDVEGATVVPVFTSPERLIEAARAAGTGTEYIRLPFTVALRYWPHPDWQLAINSGSPAGGTVQAQQLPGLATWADQRAAQRMTDGFEPQNEIEQRLFDAARRRDTETFYAVLLSAQVLVPAEPDTPWGITPDDPAFPWQPVNVHGRTSIQVFTSLKWMNDALSSSRFVMPTLLDLVSAWPESAWTFVLNPGTPIDASMPGDQVRALAGPPRTVPEEPATPPSAATPPPPDAPAVPVAPPVPATDGGPPPAPAGNGMPLGHPADDPARTAADSLGTRVAPEPSGAPDPAAASGTGAADDAQLRGLLGVGDGPPDRPTAPEPAAAGGTEHERPGHAPETAPGAPTSFGRPQHAPSEPDQAGTGDDRHAQTDGLGDPDSARPHGLPSHAADIPGTPTGPAQETYGPQKAPFEQAAELTAGAQPTGLPSHATGRPSAPSAQGTYGPHEQPSEPGRDTTPPDALHDPSNPSQTATDGPSDHGQPSHTAAPEDPRLRGLTSHAPGAPSNPAQAPRHAAATPTYETQPEAAGAPEAPGPTGLPGHATGATDLPGTAQPPTPGAPGDPAQAAEPAAAGAQPTVPAQETHGPHEQAAEPSQTATDGPAEHRQPSYTAAPEDPRLRGLASRAPEATDIPGTSQSAPPGAPSDPVQAAEPTAGAQPPGLEHAGTIGAPETSGPYGLPSRATDQPTAPSAAQETHGSHEQGAEFGQGTTPPDAQTPDARHDPSEPNQTAADGPADHRQPSYAAAPEDPRPQGLSSHATGATGLPGTAQPTAGAPGDPEHAGTIGAPGTSGPYGLPRHAADQPTTPAAPTDPAQGTHEQAAEPGQGTTPPDAQTPDARHDPSEPNQTATDGPADHRRPSHTAAPEDPRPQGLSSHATGLPGAGQPSTAEAPGDPGQGPGPAAAEAQPTDAEHAGTIGAPETSGPYGLPSRATDQPSTPAAPTDPAQGTYEPHEQAAEPGQGTTPPDAQTPDARHDPSEPNQTATDGPADHRRPSHTAAPEDPRPQGLSSHATGATGLPGTAQPPTPEGHGDPAQATDLPQHSAAPPAHGPQPETDGEGGRGLHAVPEAEPAFEPGNRIDQELYEATLAGDSDAFLRILLNANVLVPIPEDAPLEVTPIQRDFRWDAALRDDASVRVFTSLVRLREVLPEVRFVYADFRELIGVWPQAEWAMLLNPGTRIGASLRGEQVRALSEWALRVGLVQLRQETPLPQPRPPEPEPVARPRPAADPDDRVSQLAIMQKVVPHGHVAWYLEQGYDRVGGFVHLTSDVAELQTPAQLYEALGLLYDDSPFAPGDEGVYVIRWPAYCPDVYRVPFGGATEAEMAAWGESGWVVERGPFVGTGFAPGSAGSIREFKVDSIRLPYGSEMYILGPDRSERFVAMYDPDRLGWLRPEAGAEGWDGRTEAAQ